MALRLVQLKLPDAEYDSITEIIADQKFVTTWPDHRVSGQLILQLVAPAEACEAIMDKFEQLNITSYKLQNRIKDICKNGF